MNCCSCPRHHRLVDARHASDTDVACGVWDGEIYILGIKDRRTGKPQTLLGERVDVATGQADAPEQSAV
jgi:hypothetical protein